MEAVSEKNNFLYLTVGIVLLLFVGAISDQFSGLIGHQMIQAFSVINILIGIYGFKTSHVWFHSPLGIFVSVVVLAIIGVGLELLQLYYLHLLILI